MLHFFPRYNQTCKHNLIVSKNYKIMFKLFYNTILIWIIRISKNVNFMLTCINQNCNIRIKGKNYLMFVTNKGILYYLNGSQTLNLINLNHILRLNSYFFMFCTYCIFL